MISIGHIAKTYGLLPSEVLERATTFDLMVTDVYTTWERHENDKANGRPTDLTNVDPAEIKQMWEAAKDGKQNKQQN
jgi:hypothetical protein